MASFKVRELAASDPDFTCRTVCLPVSPPQESITGTEWWTDYQPVSYILTSKRGDQAQFESMIETCHAAGVGVIVGERPLFLLHCHM